MIAYLGVKARTFRRRLRHLFCPHRHTTPPEVIRQRMELKDCLLVWSECVDCGQHVYSATAGFQRMSVPDREKCEQTMLGVVEGYFARERRQWWRFA